MAQAVIDPHALPEGQLLRPNDGSIAAAWAMCFFAVLAALLFLDLFGPPIPGRHSHDSHLDNLLRVILGLVWIGFGLTAVRKVRSGVIVEKEGIVVRSRIRSSRYQWSEINEFQWRPSLTKKALQIHLKDGRRIYPHGLRVKTLDEAHRAKEMVAELNRRASGSSVE